MSKFDKDLAKIAIGGIVGGATIGGDDSTFSTLLGVGVGATVGALGNFNFSDNAKLKGRRLATKEVFRDIERDSITKNSKTHEEKVEDLLNKAKAHAKNNTNTATSLDKNDIHGTLNTNTLPEYEDYIKSSASPETLTKHDLIFKNKDSLINLKEGVNTDLLVGQSYTRLNAEAKPAVRIAALKNELEAAGFKRGTPEFDLKLKRISSLVNIPNTVVTMKDGVLNIDGKVDVRLTSYTHGENNILTPYHIGGNSVYDVSPVNPFGKAIVNNDPNKAFKAVAQALTPEMQKQYKIQEMLSQSSGLAPDEALGLAHKYISHLPEKEQIQALEKISEGFNASYSFNGPATDAFRDNRTSGIDFDYKPSSYSGQRGASIQFADSLNFDNVTGTLDAKAPIVKLGTVSKNGITKSENKQLIEKLSIAHGLESLAGTKADHVTSMPALNVRKYDPLTNSTSSIANPYNTIISGVADIGRDLGVVNNREYGIKTLSSLDQDAKYLYSMLGVGQQFDTSVALRSKTFNPELVLNNDGRTLGEITANIFGSTSITADGFGLMSKDSAKHIYREGKETASLNSIKDDSGHSFSVVNKAHRDILQGKTTIDEVRDLAKRSLTTLDERTTSNLNQVISNYQEINNLLQQPNFYDQLVNRGIITDKVKNKIETSKTMEEGLEVLHNHLLSPLRKNNVKLLRGNSSSSYREDATNFRSQREEVFNKFTKLDRRNPNIQGMISNLESIRDNHSYTDAIKEARDGYYLTAGSTLGYNTNGSRVTVPKMSHSYTLSSMNIMASTDLAGDVSYDQLVVGMNSKFKLHEELHTKTFGAASKAQVEITDHDSLLKHLILQDFAEQGNVQYHGDGVDLKRDKLTFKVSQVKTNSNQESFKIKLKSIPQQQAPSLHEIITTGKLDLNNRSAYEAEAKQYGLEKEVNSFIKRATKSQQTNKRYKGKQTSFTVLDKPQRMITVTAHDFKTKSIEDLFGTVITNTKVNKGQIASARKQAKINAATQARQALKANQAPQQSLGEALAGLFGQSQGKLGKATANGINTILNSNIDKLQIDAAKNKVPLNTHIQTVLKNEMTNSLGIKNKPNALGHTVTNDISSAVGSALTKTFEDLNLKGSQNATLGHVLRTNLGSNLGQQLSDNLISSFNSSTVTNSNTGKTLGSAISSVVGSTKIDNKTFATNIGQAISSSMQSFTAPKSAMTTVKTTVLPKEIKQIVETNKQLGLLLDEDSTGGSAVKKLITLLESHQTPEFKTNLKEQIPSKVLRKAVVRQLNQNSDKATISGLSNFLMSYGNKEKASQENLVTPLTNVYQKTKFLVEKVQAEDTKQNREALRTFTYNMTGKDIGLTSDSADHAGQALGEELQFVHSHYKGEKGLAGNLYELTQDDARMDRLTSFFINANKYANEGLGNVTESTFDRRAEGVAGIGGRDKTMSWLSSKQLRDNGFTLDELNLYAKLDSNTAADDQIVTMLTKKGAPTINSKLESSGNERGLKRILNLSNTRRRGELKAQGYNVNGLVAAYEPSYKGNNGFKQIPIILEDTNLFGEFTKDGVTKNKRVNTLFDRLIQTDLQYRSAKSDKERKALAAKMDSYTSEIKNHLMPLLSGRDNLGKALQTRQLLNGTYSRALPTYGALDRYAQRTAKSSVGSVSMEGLRHRLKNIDKRFLGGVDINKISDTEMLNQSFMKKTKEGLYEIMLEHKGVRMPLHAIVTREPSAGPGSSLMTDIVFDPRLKSKAGYLHTRASDKMNKALRFLDFDADTLIEAFPHLTKKNFDIALEARKKGVKLNKTLEGIADFADYLGVKGKKKGLSSFFEIQDTNTKGKAGFTEAFIQDVVATKEKGASRKSLAPSVTNVSQQMSEAVMQNIKGSTSTAETEKALRSRVLSHYITENLIKSLHKPTKEYQQQPVSTAEILNNHLQSGNIQAFNRTLDEYIETDLIKGQNIQGIKDKATRDNVIQQVRDSSKQIQESMLSRTAEDSIVTPGDLPNLRGEKKFEEAVENYSKMKGDNAANPTVAIAETGEEGFTHEAKKGYHTASEVVKENFSKNKKLFIGAGAAAVGISLLTQKKPDFGDNKAHANTSGMLLASGRTALEETNADVEMRGSSNPATEYINKLGTGAKQLTINAERMSNARGDENQDMNSALLGDTGSSIRVINNI